MFSTKPTGGYVLAETPRHRLSVWPQLPPTVKEILGSINGCDDTLDHIACIDADSGLSWLVNGSRVVVWGTNQSQVPFCKVIRLPASSPSSSSRLVAPIRHSSSSGACGRVGLLVVSDSGTVRFWPNVAQTSICHESRLSLALDQYASWLDTSGKHGSYVVASTSGALHWIVVNISALSGDSSKLSDNVNMLSCGSLQSTRHGMLSNLGRRVGSLFGLVGGEVADTESDVQDDTLLRVISRHQAVIVLTNRRLIRWNLSPDKIGDATVEVSVNLHALITDSLCDEEESQTGERPELRVWIMDASAATRGGRDQLVVLVGSVLWNAAEEYVPLVSYSLVFLDVTTSDVATLGVLNLDYTPDYDEMREMELFSLRIVVPRHCAAAFIYGGHIVILTQIPNDDRELDAIELRDPSERIIGAGWYSGEADTALFLSLHHGVVAVTQFGVAALSLEDDHTETSAINTSVAAAALGTDGDDAAISAEAEAQPFFIPFARYLAGDKRLAVADAERVAASLNLEVLDTYVVGLSCRVMDAHASANEHWAEATGALEGGEGGERNGDSRHFSLDVQRQLEYKKSRHDALLAMLSQGVVTLVSPSTHISLLEHSQKVAAALAIRTHQNHPDQRDGLQIITAERQLLEGAIRRCLHRRGVSESSWTRTGASMQELFFRELSHLDDIFIGLQEEQDSRLYDSPILGSRAVTVVAANNLFDVMLAATDSVVAVIPLPNATELMSSSTSWLGSRSTRTLLSHQVDVTQQLITELSRSADETRLLAKLLDQLFILTTTLLAPMQIELSRFERTTKPSDDVQTGFLSELEQSFDRYRTMGVAPFVEMGQRDRAYILAERFADVRTLATLVEEDNDEERTLSYMSRFASYGFSDAFFQQCLAGGRRAKLLSLPPSMHAALDVFLEGHPQLAWLHDIRTKRFHKAAITLSSLAKIEISDVSRRKTLYSLAKLSQLASDRVGPIGVNAANVSDIDTALEIVQLQAMLPSEALPPPREFENEAVENRALSADELIIAYTNGRAASSSSDATLYMRALRVLELSAHERSAEAQRDMALYIWARTIAAEQKLWLELAQRCEQQSLSDVEEREAFHCTLLYLTVRDAIDGPLALHPADVEATIHVLPDLHDIAEHPIATRLILTAVQDAQLIMIN